MGFGLGSLNPVHIVQKVNNTVVKPVVKTTENVVLKARDLTETALATSFAPMTLNQARGLTSKSAQGSTADKVGSAIGKVEIAGSAVAVTAVAAPAVGATVKAAATAIKTAALAKALNSKPTTPASLAPAAPPEAAQTTPNPAKAGLLLTGAVALLQLL